MFNGTQMQEATTTKSNQTL